MAAQEDREFGRLLNRVEAEYQEMPGLCVNLPQACRLWHLDKATCEQVLDALVHDHFLRLTRKGLFVKD
jgi:hypothetical protein